MRARFVSLCLAVLLGCSGDDEELQVEPAPNAILGGCLELSGSTCTLESPKSLTVWVDTHPATPLRVRTDGAATASTGRPLHGGVLLSFGVGESTRTIQVDSPDVSWNPPTTWDLTWEAPPNGEARPGESRDAQLERVVGESSGWQKLRALDARRRLHSDFPSGIDIGNAELALAQQMGAATHQTYVLGTQARWYIEQAQDLEQARRRLTELEALTHGSPIAAARWHYYSGLFARTTDELAVALDHFIAARVLYEKLGDPAALEPLESEAVTLAELGRAEDAQRRAQVAFGTATFEDLGCEASVRRANNFAWAQLILASGGQPLGDPRPRLEQALDRLPECDDAWYETSLLISLAMAEHLEGHGQDALGWLSRIDYLDPGLEAWVEEIQGRTSELTGGGAPLVAKAAPTRDYGLQWNQAVREARALAAWGFFELAAASYQRAEDLLTASANRVGVDPSTAPYLAGRTASLQGLVESMLELGRDGAASCAVRLARAREIARIDRVARLELATPDARQRWSREVEFISEQQRALEEERSRLWELSDAERVASLARLEERSRATQTRLDHALENLGIQPTPTRCDELRSPAPGEVILTIFDDYAFAANDGGVISVRIDRLGELDVLADAALISIVAAGEGALTPIHALAWRDGKTLMDLAPVAYSLDLRARTTTTAEGSALVVADTRSDLPQARQEANEVALSLRQSGIATTLVQGAEASRAVMLEALPSVDILHYAGHGSRDGFSGWDSALLLADDERILVSDILTLDRVPRSVVLTGCETAAATPRSVGGGMNIARAFVVSGTEWVVATDTEVRDEYAAEVGVSLHASRGRTGPEKLRDALIAMRTRDPDAPWQHFRVITP